MRAAVLLAMLIFSMAIAAAPVDATEKITHDGWHFSHESVTVNGVVFNLDLGYSADKLLLRFDDNLDFVELGTCKILPDTNYVIKVCFSDTDWDIDEKKIKFRVRFYSRYPDIEMTRTIGEEELSVGEETQIDVTIRNTGEARAANISFIDYFPEGIEIVDTDGVSVEGNATVWQRSSLDAGDEREFSYTIKAADRVNMKLKAYLTYFDGLEMQEMYSDEIHLRVQDFMRLTSVLKEEIYVGEETNITINLSHAPDDEDTGEDEAEIEYLDILFPDSIEVTDPPLRMQKVGERRYRWSGELRENRSKTWEFDIRGIYTGVADIQFYAQYEKDGRTYSLQNLKDSTVIKDRGVIIRCDLEDDNEIESFEKKNIRIWVQNLNAYAMLKDVRIKIDGGAMFISDVYVDWMDEQEQKKVADFAFVGPDIKSSRSDEINVRIMYETEYGDEGGEEEDFSYSLVPVDNLEITQDPDDTTIEEEETTYFRVSVKNNRNTDVRKVHVYDTADSRFQKRGLSEDVVNINKDSKTEIYAYKITAPKVRKEQDICINTTVEYKDESGNYTYVKERCITVKPREIKFSVSKDVAEDERFRGQIINMEYEIRNQEDAKGDTAYNLRIDFPLAQGYDTLDSREYLINQLDPGESVTVDREEQIRIRFNRSKFLIPETMIWYEDKDGNTFNVNTSSKSISTDSGYITGPAILLNKTAEVKEINESESFQVRLLVTNIGTDMATGVKVQDDGKEWSIMSMAPGSSKEFTYSKTLMRPGKHVLPQAVASYRCMGRDCWTGSDQPKIKVSEKEKPEKEQPTETPAQEEKSAASEAEPAEEEEPSEQEAPGAEEEQKSMLQ
ncbi:hypothetical protein GF351_01680, partial [Candidatus Woesearchaeota archaeon]|nr:hypothetical protein [Candidatus Woesearchaeota archaeon]